MGRAGIRHPCKSRSSYAVGNRWGIALARYNPNGTLDGSFAADGKVVTNFQRGDDRADMVAVQMDGKVVAAGTAGYFGSNARSP
jgi:Domain of unknown function (DUF5122) beta-propeller